MKINLLLLPLLVLAVASCAKKEEVSTTDGQQKGASLSADSRKLLEEKMKKNKPLPTPAIEIKENSKETPPQLVESLRRNLYGLPEKTQKERLQKLLEQNPRLKEFKGLEGKVLTALKDKTPLAPEKAPTGLIKSLRTRLEPMNAEQRKKEMERIKTTTNLFSRYPDLEKQLSFESKRK